jgi:hypothetical protein
MLTFGRAGKVAIALRRSSAYKRELEAALDNSNLQ